jgi:hypothetical protein
LLTTSVNGIITDVQGLRNLSNELTPTSPGLGESSKTRSETSDGKDKKDTRRPVTSLRFPFEAPKNGSVATEKSQDRPLAELFRRPLEDALNEPKVDTLGKTKDHDTLLSQTEEDRTAEKTTEPEVHIPTSDEAAAFLEAAQLLEPTRPAEQSEREEEPRVEAIQLPSLEEEGELEIPLNVEASELHTKLQFPKAETEAQPAPEPSDRTEKPEVGTETPVTQEAAVKPPRQTAEAGGGGSHNQPPRGPEQPFGGAEKPNQPPEPHEVTAARNWHNQAAQQHQERLDSALRVDQSPAPVAAPIETRIIDRSGDALLVGIIDWFGRRRIRKELRRGQKRQDKQIKKLQIRQRKSDEALLQQQTEQRSASQRLRQQYEAVVSRLSGNESRTQRLEKRKTVLPELPVPAARAEAVKPLLQTAMAEAAVEQSPQVPSDHHLQHSTWHSIEVDKAGRAVENPVFAYGQEFRREKYQETRPADVRIAATATGQVAVTGTASDTQPATVPNGGLQLPPSMLDSTTPKQPTGELRTRVQSPLFLVLVIITFFVVVSILIMR